MLILLASILIVLFKDIIEVFYKPMFHHNYGNLTDYFESCH